MWVLGSSVCVSVSEGVCRTESTHAYHSVFVHSSRLSCVDVAIRNLTKCACFFGLSAVGCLCECQKLQIVL